MFLRNYAPTDCPTLAALFYDTVHTVNAKDYTCEQLDAWAPGTVDLDAWDRSFRRHHTVIAEADHRIVGFGDLDENGRLDRLYTHCRFQRKGVATRICNVLEAAASDRTLTTDASITALPFFLKRGYQVRKEQWVCRNGVYLTNYALEKPPSARKL